MPKRAYTHSETIKIGAYRFYLYKEQYTDRWFGKVVAVYQDGDGRFQAEEIIPEPPNTISFGSRLELFTKLLSLFDPWGGK